MLGSEEVVARKENGGWEMGDGRWEMEDGRWKMGDGRWKTEGGRWKIGGSCRDPDEKLFRGRKTTSKVRLNRGWKERMKAGGDA